jgi:hypothetical protein
MVSKAFTSAWDHYPMTLVWSFPEDYQQMQALDQRLSIEAIMVTDERERDVVLEAGATGFLKQRYVSLFPYKVDGYYFLVSESLADNR